MKREKQQHPITSNPQDSDFVGHQTKGLSFDQVNMSPKQTKKSEMTIICSMKDNSLSHLHLIKDIDFGQIKDSN